MLQFGLIKPEYHVRNNHNDKTLGPSRPFSAEHSSTRSNQMNKKVSKLSSVVFNEDIAEFDRDFDDELTLTKGTTSNNQVDEEALS
jgi:hypothetical protein